MMNREQQGLNIDFNQTTAETCEKCNNDTLVAVVSGGNIDPDIFKKAIEMT